MITRILQEIRRNLMVWRREDFIFIVEAIENYAYEYDVWTVIQNNLI